MKTITITLATIVAATGLACASETVPFIKLRDGKDTLLYEARLSAVEGNKVRLMHRDGAAVVEIGHLPSYARDAWNLDAPPANGDQAREVMLPAAAEASIAPFKAKADNLKAAYDAEIESLVLTNSLTTAARDRIKAKYDAQYRAAQAIVDGARNRYRTNIADGYTEAEAMRDLDNWLNTAEYRVAINPVPTPQPAPAPTTPTSRGNVKPGTVLSVHPGQKSVRIMGPHNHPITVRVAQHQGANCRVGSMFPYKVLGSGNEWYVAPSSGPSGASSLNGARLR